MNRSQGRSVIKPGLAMRSLLVSFVLVAMSLTAPALVAQKVELSVDVSKAGAKIDRNIFGQFAEHLGHGVYEGIWVGPDSTIPNTRGIRNDVVAALKVLKVPNVRWPGGCFADEYHWRKGIGAQRVVTLNPNWGGVIEPNTFGTHEFMDFLNQIGSEAYVSVNVGSGHSAGSCRMAGVHDHRATDDVGQGARRQRSSRSLSGRLPWYRQRKLGLRRQHDTGLLSEPA